MKEALTARRVKGPNILKKATISNNEEEKNSFKVFSLNPEK
jgi:hypothetical protein